MDKNIREANPFLGQGGRPHWDVSYPYACHGEWRFWINGVPKLNVKNIEKTIFQVEVPYHRDTIVMELHTSDIFSSYTKRTHKLEDAKIDIGIRYKAFPLTATLKSTGDKIKLTTKELLIGYNKAVA